jgi:acyl-coenzyme A thioesterase PaaI-like protein
MLDFAMAFAAFARLVPDVSVGSATLTINFMKPLPGLLIARGRVVRMGSRLIFAEAELSADTSNLTAAATTVMAVVPTKN